MHHSKRIYEAGTKSRPSILREIPVSRCGYRVVAARFKASLSNPAVACTTGITFS